MTSHHTPNVAEWDNEYARLARAASQLRTTGLVANNNNSNNNNNATSVMALQQGLQRLDHGLNTLPLSASEIHRRRRLIQHLHQTSQVGTNTAAAMSMDVMNMNVAPTSQQQQQSTMGLAMMQQDAMIDQLAVGVGRLKTQTAAISDEARMHVNLLNDMEVRGKK
jgi:hypothetical protein